MDIKTNRFIAIAKQSTPTLILLYRRPIVKARPTHDGIVRIKVKKRKRSAQAEKIRRSLPGPMLILEK
jgi:hypothetical protein